MSEPSTNRQNLSQPGSARSTSAVETPGQNVSTPVAGTRADSEAVQLDSGHGKTIIAEGVVAKIAGVAAREVDGVHDLVPIGAGATIAGFAGRLTRSDQRSTGVNVEVGQREAAVDLNMTVDYGVNIPQIAEAVRQNIMDRIHAMTGLVVKEVNINAADLYFPGEQEAQQTRVQ
ncbi:MAG TPA: Asp23/Gls24 family envelope stress response protein [Ktedonobacterales bacterium]|nr:Asp23/Gls24 family envelope stress response protein [Ktedonobacterales bacterium]